MQNFCTLTYCNHLIRRRTWGYQRVKVCQCSKVLCYAIFEWAPSWKTLNFSISRRRSLSYRCWKQHSRRVPRKRCSENTMLPCSFIEIIYLLHIFRTPFLKNLSGGLLLKLIWFLLHFKKPFANKIFISSNWQQAS